MSVLHDDYKGNIGSQQAQNVFMPPEFNDYMKGTFLSDAPSKDLSREKFNRVIAFCQGDMNVAMILEYLPHGKINSVPEDATPYRRNIPGNNLFLIQWEENSPEKQQLARRIAHDLADLMPEGEGYGNYSKLSRLKGCVVYIYSYFRQVASTTLLFIKTGLRPLRRFKCSSANITLSCKESKRNTIQT